ncbi:MAG: branched-chain amino acid ABC transporter permease [Desulfurococcales archaeon]|nr:branched-chain amino acid ABC transporter permease [Desulfurococcales archaeon]
MAPGKGLMLAFTRKGFYLSLALLAVFIVIGVLFWYGRIGANIPGYAMDAMYYIGIALSMAIIMSYAGYVSFGHVVFYGVGGWTLVYTFNRLASESGVLSFLHGHSYAILVVGTLLGMALAVLLAVTVGAAVLRLRGAFFAIATIGLDYVILYLESLYATGGSDYMYIGYERFLEKTYFLYLAGLILTVLIAYIIRVSKFGYGLAAIREDEDAAEVLGVNTYRYKVQAFAIAAAMAALWGSLSSWRTSGIFPDFFSLSKSVDMIVMNVIGGLGTFNGPIIGSLIYYVIIKATQLYAKDLAYIIVGAIVIIVVSVFPEGVAGLIKSKYRQLREYLI